MNHNRLVMEMIQYYEGDPARIQHFLKVYEFSKLMGELEGLDEKTRNILEAAALVHDIGIKKSEELYGDSAGKHQEELGPEIAEEMLKGLAYPEDLIERVSYLVGHHHTYSDIQGLDYQILVEADFLVNLYEDHSPKTAVESALKKIFKTESGRDILQKMFGLFEG